MKIDSNFSMHTEKRRKSNRSWKIMVNELLSTRKKKLNFALALNFQHIFFSHLSAVCLCLTHVTSRRRYNAGAARATNINFSLCFVIFARLEWILCAMLTLVVWISMLSWLCLLFPIAVSRLRARQLFYISSADEEETLHRRIGFFDSSRLTSLRRDDETTWTTKQKFFACGGRDFFVVCF